MAACVLCVIETRSRPATKSLISTLLHSGSATHRVARPGRAQRSVLTAARVRRELRAGPSAEAPE